MDSNFKQFLVTVETILKTDKDCNGCIFFDDEHNANFDCGDLCPGGYKIWVFTNRKPIASICKYTNQHCPGKVYIDKCGPHCNGFDPKLILNRE